MKLLIIGTGYVGTTTALVFAEMGWKVTGLDRDHKKIEQLSQGSLYFFEQGLELQLVKQLKEGNLSFTSDTKMAIRQTDVLFICVGTPSRSNGSADLKYIKQVAEDIGRYMNSYKLIVIKSTVPVGTNEKMKKWIQSSQKTPQPFDVVSNPEFLREGNALHDTLYPDRVVIGASNEKAIKIMKEIYRTMQCPVIITAPRTAEMIKYAANAFLATKISYINEMARLCDKLDINVLDVSRGIGLDTRIGQSFLQAGSGYGGSCFPKDIAALLHTAKELDIKLSILEKVTAVNESQQRYILDQIRPILKGFHNKTISLLGLSFKPGTDDIRDAPSLRFIQSLLSENACIKVHDPVAKLPLNSYPKGLQQCDTPEQSIIQADAVIICTNWPLYRELDWTQLKGSMKRPFIYDGRNMLDAEEMKALGYHYQGIGYH